MFHCSSRNPHISIVLHVLSFLVKKANPEYHTFNVAMEHVRSQELVLPRVLQNCCYTDSVEVIDSVRLRSKSAHGEWNAGLDSLEKFIATNGLSIVLQDSSSCQCRPPPANIVV